MLQAPSQSLLGSLRDVVGLASVIDGADRLIAYESDALTQYRHTPSAVVLPRDTEEVSRVLSLLHEAGLPVVPRGAGTGLSGGALAENGAVLVGTARMNRILTLDPADRVARVQPGVINERLSTAARPHGLYYAPDPSSQSACTLGGNVAENSGGPHCLKYGVTSRYVCGLTLVLPNGEVVNVGNFWWRCSRGVVRRCEIDINAISVDLIRSPLDVGERMKPRTSKDTIDSGEVC